MVVLGLAATRPWTPGFRAAGCTDDGTCCGNGAGWLAQQ